MGLTLVVSEDVSSTTSEALPSVLTTVTEIVQHEVNKNNMGKIKNFIIPKLEKIFGYKNYASQNKANDNDV